MPFHLANGGSLCPPGSQPPVRPASLSYLSPSPLSRLQAQGSAPSPDLNGQVVLREHEMEWMAGEGGTFEMTLEGYLNFGSLRRTR